MRCWLALLTLCLGVTALARAQAPAFEAATVKRNPGQVGMETLFQAGAFRAQNHTVRELARYAYQMQTFRIVGGPDWLHNLRFDVTGKAEGPTTRANLSAMLRTLLTERFKLAVHHETRQMPIYALVTARDDRRLGPQLRPGSASTCRASGPSWLPNELTRCGALLQNPGMFTGRSVTLTQLTTEMSQNLDRLVVDKTGLTGPFDLDLKWDAGLADTATPALFTALREQLGLKLDAQRGPVEVLVIDSVERPSEN